MIHVFKLIGKLAQQPGSLVFQVQLPLSIIVIGLLREVKWKPAVPTSFHL